MSGEVNILEYMAQNDYLGRYYREAAGFESLNDSVGGLVAQITNKYPHMNFCEVGAGTGGATKAVLDVVGNAFASYTYTDISSGFFETAQSRFHVHHGKMIYKTLNIEHDPVDQGFVSQAYDCVVAANVLHATKSLETTLRNVRRLLKPGGYLILFEIIGNNVMRIPMVMGGLPGWWIGHEDGRKYAPTIEIEEWDTILRRTGFSGVDTHTPMTDKVSLPGAIFCSMACDEHIDILRNPLVMDIDQSAHGCLVILHGKSDIGKQLLGMLELHFAKVVVAENLDALPEIPPRANILSLQDYGDSIFENLTELRWSNLQRLLESPQTLLWVTSDAHCSSPYAGMSIGLFRSLSHELMGCLVQTLDCEAGHTATDLHTIAELVLRLRKLASLSQRDEDADILWTVEPELRLHDGRLEVQRVRSARERNDRLNSRRRPVFQGQDSRTAFLDLRFENGSHLLEETQGAKPLANGEFVAVRVTTSFLQAVKTPMGHAFVCLGFNEDSGEKVLCLSETNSSRVVIHKSWTRTIAMEVIDRQYLSLVIGALVNQQIVDALPSSGALLAYEPDLGLASLLSKQMSIQNRSVLFITSRPKMQHHRGKWVSLHCQCTSRTIAGIIPNGLSTYLYSSHLAADSGRLDERIRQLLPPHCQTMDADVCVSRRAAKLPREAASSVTDLLQRVTEFAESQLNGVPDGVALETLSLHDIILATEPFDVTAKFLVDWDSDVSAPVRIKPVSSRPDLFSGDKTYWLAGLSGDLGRSLADFMIAHGARYVVLSSRNPKEEKPWIDWHLSEQGAEVKYFQNDVADYTSVENTFKQIIESMPPLGGVALGALVLCDRMFAQMRLDEFQQVMDPKVQGTLNFSRLFSLDSCLPPLDWFIGFSSIVATMGNPGQANYSAANCFIKAVINQRRAQGLAGSVIDISRVIGVGYVEREMKSDGRLTREQKERLFTGSMTLPMSETDLHQLFAEAIVSGRPAAVDNGSHDIITGMAPVRKENAHHKSWPNNPKFGLLVKVGEESLAEMSEQASNRIPIKKLLAEAESRDEKGKILKGTLQSQ
jgi:NAD(P)-dependent dehydrogenase (short-subunit alcohol dehydrogenase family)/SAM-dependent methyltransferase